MIYYTDGYCAQSNPSPKGGGYTIVTNENKLVKSVKNVQKGFTNNEAELLGVLAAMRIAKEYDSIITDSQNTIYWIWAGKCGARPDLTPMATEAKKLMIDKRISLAWLPREYNFAGIYNEQFDVIK